MSILPRPYAILFGDSLTQRSFDHQTNGWGLQLSSYWAAKVDVLNRGFSGYNSRFAGYLLQEVFGANKNPPVFVTIFWGANDSCDSSSPQHVPLTEYEANLVGMVEYIRTNSGSSVSITIISPPAFFLDKWRQWCQKNAKTDAMWQCKSNASVSQYAEAASRVAKEKGCVFVDLYGAMMAQEAKLAEWLSDGLHLSSSGNKFVFSAVQEAIEKHLPSLSAARLDFPFPYWANVDPAHLDESFPGRSNVLNTNHKV